MFIIRQWRIVNPPAGILHEKYIHTKAKFQLLTLQVMVEPCVFYRMLNSSFTVLVRRGVSPVYVSSPFMPLV